MRPCCRSAGDVRRPFVGGAIQGGRGRPPMRHQRDRRRQAGRAHDRLAGPRLVRIRRAGQEPLDAGAVDDVRIAGEVRGQQPLLDLLVREASDLLHDPVRQPGACLSLPREVLVAEARRRGEGQREECREDDPGRDHGLDQTEATLVAVQASADAHEQAPVRHGQARSTSRGTIGCLRGSLEASSASARPRMSEKGRPEGRPFHTLAWNSLTSRRYTC